MNTSRKPNSYSDLRQKIRQSTARATKTTGRENRHPLDDEQKLLEILQHLSQQGEDLTAHHPDRPAAPAPPIEEPSPIGWFDPSRKDNSPTASASEFAETALAHSAVSEHEMMDIPPHLSQQAEILAVTAPDASSVFTPSVTEAPSHREGVSSSGRYAQTTASAPDFAEPVADYWIVSEQDVMGDLHHLSEQIENLEVADPYQSQASLGEADLDDNHCSALEAPASVTTASTSPSYVSGNLLTRLGLTSLVVTGGGVGAWLTASVLNPSVDDSKSDERIAWLADRAQNQTDSITATIAAPVLDSLSPEFNPAVIKSAKLQTPLSSAAPLESAAQPANIQATESNPLTAKSAASHSALSSLLQERLLTPEDLQGLSGWELTRLRNEIYARHGRHFIESELQQYFEAQSWYQARHAPGKFPISHLSKIEIQNAIFIRDYQHTHDKFYQWE